MEAMIKRCFFLKKKLVVVYRVVGHFEALLESPLRRCRVVFADYVDDGTEEFWSAPDVQTTRLGVASTAD